MKEKIYISGTVPTNLDTVTDHLKVLGYEINKDLRRCNSIFMLDNWVDSSQARMEYVVARELELDILYESNVRNTM